MVYIITGSINSGKTTRLLELYEQHENADGFVAVKNMMNHRVLGYDMLRLSTKEKKSFIVREDMVNDSFEVLCSIGPYFFSTQTKEWVEHSLMHMVTHRIGPIFLDEIGPLELEGQCFDNIMSELAASGCDLYITVRQSALEEVLERYSIKEYECITDPLNVL